MTHWAWLKRHEESYAIDTSRVVAFGRAKAEGVIWFNLVSENDTRFCESSLIDFCNLVGAPYKPITSQQGPNEVSQ